VEPTADGPRTWSWDAGALAPGQTMRLRLDCRGKAIDGFIVNVDGTYHAYVNRCPHAGTSLDLWPNEFLTDDRRYLICSTHGAIFERHSGLCVEGPCRGASLERLLVKADGDSLTVRCPT